MTNDHRADNTTPGNTPSGKPDVVADTAADGASGSAPEHTPATQSAARSAHDKGTSTKGLIGGKAGDARSAERPARTPSKVTLPWVLVAILSVLTISVIAMYTVQGRELARLKNGSTGANARPAATATPASGNTADANGAGGERGDNAGDGDSADQSAHDEQVRKLLLSLPRRDANDFAALGKVDAPVVMIEWSDFRCPFCARFATKTHPELMKYVDNGTLRIERRDLPVFGDESNLAARGGVAAGKQGKYWEYYSAAYEAAPASGHMEVTRDKVISFAKSAGVADMAKFEKDLDSEETKNYVTRDYNEGQSLGLQSVPFFAINETVISGAQPLEHFVNAIESELKKVR